MTDDVSMGTSTKLTDKMIPRLEGMQLQARDITVSGEGGGKAGRFSLHVEPGEFVTLSGAGGPYRSLLLETLAGLREPDGGEVQVDGVDLYGNLNAFRAYIGYVPRSLALPGHLTVLETLRHEARLFLPAGLTEAQRRERVQEVLRSVGLEDQAGRPAGALNPLEQRRLSIAVELLTRPGLLFVDALEGDLDPAAETQLGVFLQALAREGRTVVQVTDEDRCIQMADRAVILAPDGSLAWFGPPQEALAYFKSLSEQGDQASNNRPPAPFGFDQIFWLLRQPQADAGAWAGRFLAHAAYQKYLDDPLHDRRQNLLLQDRPLTRLRGSAADKLPPPPVRQPSLPARLFALLGRDLRRLGRERAGQALLLAPPLVALLDLVISSPNMLDPSTGDPYRAPVALGLLVFFNLLLAAVLFQPEILRERAVFRRERRSGVSGLAYSLSKVALVALLALYQGAVWALVHALASGGFQGFPVSAVTLALVALLGGLLGLLASSLSRTLQGASALVLALALPQLLLSGSVIPLSQVAEPFRTLSAAIPLRYAFEVLLTNSGYGRDIAADPCWRLAPDQRAGLTDAQKRACPCMGDNLIQSCRFPGVYRSFTAVIEQPAPLEPTLDPILLSHPAQPVYREGQPVEEFVESVNQYTLELEAFQGSLTSYRSSVTGYMTELAEWQRARSLQIGQAEQTIHQALERYGQGFQVNLLVHWLTLAAFCLLFIVLLSVIQTRKAVG